MATLLGGNISSLPLSTSTVILTAVQVAIRKIGLELPVRETHLASNSNILPSLTFCLYESSRFERDEATVSLGA